MNGRKVAKRTGEKLYSLSIEVKLNGVAVDGFSYCAGTGDEIEKWVREIVTAGLLEHLEAAQRRENDPLAHTFAMKDLEAMRMEYAGAAEEVRQSGKTLYPVKVAKEILKANEVHPSPIMEGALIAVLALERWDRALDIAREWELIDEARS